MKKINSGKIHRILVIKSAAIGDVLLATPVVENLRHHFPDAEIIFLTQKYCKDVLTGNPYINRTLTYDLSLDSGWCIIKNIRKQKYDLIIDLFCNPRTALITFLSGAKYKVGYRFRGRSYAYNIKVKPRGSEVHNVEFNLDSLRALNLEIITSSPKFYLNKVNRLFADNFFKDNFLDNKIVIGINPGGTWPTKVWYAEKFAELITKLEDSATAILFWGNEAEKELALKISSLAGKNNLLIPKTDLQYMAALAEKCSVFLTNDTGPMHIASSLGVDIAAIYGPTNSDFQGPLNKNSIIIKNEKLSCLGCNLTRIEDCKFEHKCMKELEVDTVLTAVKKLLNQQK